MSGVEFLGVVLVWMVIYAGKKLWYSFIEKKFPDVNWDDDEEK